MAVMRLLHHLAKQLARHFLPYLHKAQKLRYLLGALYFRRDVRHASVPRVRVPCERMWWSGRVWDVWTDLDWLVNNLWPQLS